MSAILQEAPPLNGHQALIILPQISDEPGQSLLDQARAVQIVSQETYNAAAAAFGAACQMEKEIIADHLKPKTQAHQLHKSICELEKKYLTPIQLAKQILSRAIGDWDTEQERVRREEQRRLEAEAQKRADDEALAAAVDAEQSGADADEVEAVLSSPAPVQKVQAAPTYEKSVSTRESWSAQVVSLSALVKAAAANPAYLCYLQANESALGAAARAQKQLFAVPGCKAVVQRIATRGR